MLLVLVVLGSLFYQGGSSGAGKENNVCPTFKDYYTIKNNSRCWYDLSAEYDAVTILYFLYVFFLNSFFIQPDIIRLNGYPVIEYKVQTLDGFILTLFRIPSNNPKAALFPVYLQHGLVATCANFIGLGKDSLGKLIVL